jgi:hypothetical protein
MYRTSLLSWNDVCIKTLRTLQQFNNHILPPPASNSLPTSPSSMPRNTLLVYSDMIKAHRFTCTSMDTSWVNYCQALTPIDPPSTLSIAGMVYRQTGQRLMREVSILQPCQVWLFTTGESQQAQDTSQMTPYSLYSALLLTRALFRSGAL